MNVKKVFLWSFGLLFTLGILGCAAVAGLFYWASRDLPDLERLTGYEAPQATVILARDGSTIGTLATEKRYSITLKEMSPWLPMSFLAAEDDSFYQHHGVDPVAIVRAFIYNLRNKASGGGQQMPIFTALPSFPFFPPRSIPLEVQATSYLAASDKICNFSMTVICFGICMSVKLLLPISLSTTLSMAYSLLE